MSEGPLQHLDVSVPASLASPAFEAGSVWLVGAGPGDPGLLTLYAARALEAADVILHDALVAPEILALAGPSARLESVGKRAGHTRTSQLRINQRLIELAGRGLRVVRLKGGDPFVFGRGGEEALALSAAGVRFRIVPGVTAGIGGAAYAGIPVTHREIGQAVTFVTGHGAAGHPPRGVDWRAIARSAPVLVLYMALRRMEAIAAELVAAGRDAEEPAALITDATTIEQACHVATLGSLGAAARALPARRPTLIVLGPVVNLRQAIASWQQSAPFVPTPAAQVLAAGGAV